jgi:hypothetical protein
MDVHGLQRTPGNELQNVVAEDLGQGGSIPLRLRYLQVW